MSNNLPGMPMPPGVDPRMFAFLQAQRQLQQHGQAPSSSQPPQYSHAGGSGPRIPQQPPQQQKPLAPAPSQASHPPQPPPQAQHRPGGDADVASFLLQLKMKPNGEPMTEAETLRMVQQQQQQQQQQLPPMVPPGQPTGVPGYSHPGVPIPGMYGGYPAIVSFPRNGNFPLAAAAAAMGVRQQPPHPHPPPPPGYPPVAGMHSQPVAPAPPTYVPGMGHNGHSPVQPLAAAPAGGATSAESSPVLSDAYIESLISNDPAAAAGATTTDAKTEKYTEAGDTASETASRIVKSAKDDMNIALVVPKDRDLIPDALFVALGQMKPCRLQQSDRVGCYKTRTLRFLGMSCKHCGGQPGFGRYFPNSVRSLAQTTTSQTILKHVGGKCRYCPQNVRKAVLELQRQQVHKEHLATGRPRYGSRKIFFQRMWTRLHGPSEDGSGKAKVVVADVTPELAKAERAAREASSEERSLQPAPPPAPLVKPKFGNSIVAGAAVTTTRTMKRSLPSEVSNDNTDDEGGPVLPLQRDDNDILGMSVSLNGDEHNKRRKLSDGDKESSSGEDEESKKLRVSPVAV